MEEIQRIFHDWHEWFSLITHHPDQYRGWFYLITVIWTFFEGETFVLLAGAFSANGLVDPFILGGCAWLGSYLGDQCWFFLGRICGPFMLRRFPDWQHSIDMVHRWLERWDTIFILTFRFIYGIRNFSSIAIGLSDLSIPRFMVLNFIAAGIWAVAFVSMGYLFGRELGRMLGHWTQTIELGALGVFLVSVIGILLVTRWRARRAKRMALLPAERP
jgi:membrane protein DedA with SNARE-associated domain